MSLESIVLPLKESQELEQAGIHLDTALSWYEDHHVQSDMESELRYYVAETVNSDATRDRCICGAWVLSELLDAIRTKVAKRTDETAITLMRDGKDAGASCMGIRVEGIRKYNAAPAAPTDLLAAAALLLEVSHA
jgi:hypothetical protein